MERKIYLKQEEIKLGVGSTAKVTTIENYYEMTELDNEQVKLHLLDYTDQPIGKPTVIPREKLQEYVYCPDYFKNKKTPKEVATEKHVKSGDSHFEKKEYLSAEFEYNKALDIDQDHLKANLGKGKTLFAVGKKEEARKIFSRISHIDSLFDKENKHIFNEFGIELRKKGMMDEAITNYLKAIEIDPSDEVLYYNLGRVYYEQGDSEKAIGQLKSAIEVKPDFKEAQDFLSKLESSIESSSVPSAEG